MLSDSIVRRSQRAAEHIDAIFDRRAIIPAVTSLSLAMLAFMAGMGILRADGSAMIQRTRR